MNESKYSDHAELVLHTRINITYAIQQVKQLTPDVTIETVKAYFALIYPNYSDETIQFFIDEDRKASTAQ